jgi:hypothetical protein
LGDVAIYAGAAFVVIGFGLIALAWGRVAGLHDVSLQLPYIASAGFTGGAIVVCGLSLALGGARSRDGAVQREQLEELAAILRAIESAQRGVGG